MAVYTDVDEEQLGAFLADYDLGAAHAFKGIAEGVENSNYLLTTDAGTFILTLYEKRVEPAELPFFIGLMHHLAARDIPCPAPVAGRDGEVLRHLAGRPAALFTFLEGSWPRRITAEHCRHLGGALAGFHLAAADYPGRRPNALSVDAWGPLYGRAGGSAAAEALGGGVGPTIETELSHLATHWPADLPGGVIHADLFPDNVFFKDGAVSGLIDFYFACTDLFAYDLAICLNAWCFEPDHQFNITKARALLDAYRRVRPFGAEELAALPILCRGAAMRFLLTRLFDWHHTPPGALVRPKDPGEYLKKLLFHREVPGPGAYGLDTPAR